MTKRKWLLAVLVALACGAGGCKLETGAADGLNKGASAAVSALVQAPINWWLDQTFGK